MELAISLAALSGLYIATQESKPQNTEVVENFVNGDLDPYNSKELKHEFQHNHTEIKDSNFHRDDYYNGEKNNEMLARRSDLNNTRNNTRNNAMSLTGNAIDEKAFNHNNMQPYFGAKLRGGGNSLNTSESILDSKVGTGSQKIRKQEQSPLFKPLEYMSHTHGAPNVNDFFQSRVNPSLKMSNVKPFESEQVGPGLNQGFSSQGTNGFNSGMNARETWQPKNVDELRVTTNPKTSYSLDGHQGAAMSSIKERGIEGKFEKHLPDKYYESGQERWFTTTGSEKKQTARPVMNNKDLNRASTSVYYQGNAATTGADGVTYSTETYREPTNNEYSSPNLTVASATGRNNANPNDYSKNSHQGYLTNRDTTNDSHLFGNVGSALSAAISPLVEMLKPSRKENFIGNARPYGEVQNTVSATYVHNELDTVGVTNRQMYSKSLDHYNVQSQTSGGYNVANPIAVPVQREDTSRYYSGVGSSSTPGLTLYDSAYSQEINTQKETTIVGRKPNGNTSKFNNDINVSVAKHENDRMNNRMWVPSNMSNIPPSMDTHGTMDMPHVITEQIDSNLNSNRMDPNLLTAFKNNPYTHSLNSAV